MLHPSFLNKHRPRPLWEWSSDNSIHHPAEQRDEHRTISRSSSIPIQRNVMKVTEHRLRQEEYEEAAQADLRDYIMFRRIVDRISRQDIQSYRLRYANDMCLAHVIRARHSHEDQTFHAYCMSELVASSRFHINDIAQDDDDDDEIFELEL